MSSICDLVIRICLTSTILSPIFSDCVPLVDSTTGFLIDLSATVALAPDGTGLFVGNLPLAGDFFCGALTVGLMGAAITFEGESHA